MLTILCGDNIVESRSKFIQLKESYAHKNYDIVELPNNDLKNLADQIAYSSTLFSEQRLYVIENILSKKNQREIISQLDKDHNPELLIWEETMDDRSIKKYFPKAKILIAKLPHNLWKFIDGLYPGNLAQSLNSFRAIQETVDPHLIHYMTMRRIKELMLVADNVQPTKLASWQVGKLKQQAKSWSPEHLQSFFKKLVEIEMQVKSGKMVYPLGRALEVALCFYL